MPMFLFPVRAVKDFLEKDESAQLQLITQPGASQRGCHDKRQGAQREANCRGVETEERSNFLGENGKHRREYDNCQRVATDIAK